jgi:sedoheptulokinase
MSDELYQMYKNGGKKAEKLVCSGNGIRKNSALRKVVSSMFGCEIKIPLFEEEASFGAALAASVACGMSENITQACKMIKYKEI